MGSDMSVGSLRMSFSVGPPPIGPNDPPVCAYGFVGAVRSAPRLTLTSPMAAILWVVFVSISLTVTFIASGNGGAVEKVLNAAVGVVVGTMLTYAVLVGWLISPLSRQYHWTLKIERYRGDGAETHSLFVLQSRQLHLVSGLVCHVTDPSGTTYVHAWQAPVGGDPPLRKGSGPVIAYPDEFAAPWPARGRYRVAWTIPRPGGHRLRTIYTGRWTVTD